MIPHLRYPFTVGATVATVDQGAPAEIAQCVYAVLATEPGDRAEHPAFGFESQLFRRGGVDLEELRRVVGDFEPRADLLTEATLEDLAETVRVTIQ